jgi:hypothetical protein
MELRSYNVEKVWREVVTVRMGNGIGVRRELLTQHTEDIKDMLGQLAYKKNMAMYFNTRADGETWTPYMQIVEMLLLMGERIGCVKIHGNLSAKSLVEIQL